MLIMVNKENSSRYGRELSSMHRLRKKVFKDEMKWPVNVISEMEFDQFDNDDACYLMHINPKDGEVDGSTRLIPTTKPYLLGDVFPQLIASGNVPREENIWETTRFCSDTDRAPKEMIGILAAGMLEFALMNGIKEYVSVSDIRIEPLIKRYGWVPERLGDVIDTGTEKAAGERFLVSPWTYRVVTAKCPFKNGSVISNITEQTNDIKKAA